MATSTSSSETSPTPQVHERLRTEVTSLRSRLHNERDAVRELRAQHAQELRTERTKSRHRQQDLMHQIQEVKNDKDKDRDKHKRCDECAKVKNLHEAELRSLNNEFKKRENDLKQQLKNIPIPPYLSNTNCCHECAKIKLIHEAEIRKLNVEFKKREHLLKEQLNQIEKVKTDINICTQCAKTKAIYDAEVRKINQEFKKKVLTYKEQLNDKMVSSNTSNVSCDQCNKLKNIHESEIRKLNSDFKKKEQSYKEQLNDKMASQNTNTVSCDQCNKLKNIHESEIRKINSEFKKKEQLFKDQLNEKEVPPSPVNLPSCDQCTTFKHLHDSELRKLTSEFKKKEQLLKAQLNEKTFAFSNNSISSSCEQCAKLKASYEAQLRKIRVENKKKEQSLKGQLNELRKNISVDQNGGVCQSCQRLNKEVLKQKEVTKDLEEKLQKAIDADRLKAADLRAQHEKHVTELSKITRASKHDAHKLLEELKTKDRIIEQLRRSAYKGRLKEEGEMRKLREEVRKNDQSALLPPVCESKSENHTNHEKFRQNEIDLNSIKQKDQMVCGASEELLEHAETDTDSAVSSAPSSLSPQPCTGVVSRGTPPPTSLSPQPSEGYTTPPTLWPDLEAYEDDSSELTMARRQVRELERALLVTRASKSSSRHVAALSDRVRQLEEREAELLRELSDLREQNELLEFRILELAECPDKSSFSTTAWTVPDHRDAGTTTEDVSETLNDEPVRRRIAEICNKTEDDEDKNCLMQILILLHGLEEMSKKCQPYTVDTAMKIYEERECTPPISLTSVRSPRDRLIAKVPPFTGRSAESDEERDSPLRSSASPAPLCNQSTQTDVWESLNLTAEVRKLDKLRETIDRNGRLVVQGNSCSGCEHKNTKQLEFYRERLDTLEKKLCVYESSGELQHKQLAERLSREIRLEAQVKQLTATVTKLQTENSRLEEERCELEEAENDTRLRCQRLEQDIVQIERSKMASKRKAKENRQQANYWESMVNKYEERNYELEERACDLQMRLEIMEKTTPAILLFNMWKMMQTNPDMSIAQEASQRLRNIPSGRSRSTSPEKKSQNCSCSGIEKEIKCLEKERAKLLGEQEKMVKKVSILEQHLSDLKRSQTDTTAPSTSHSEFSESDGAQSSDTSLLSGDFKMIEAVKDLRDREMKMRKRIEELEKREAAYMETLQQADEIWAEMEGGYKQRINEAEQSESRMRERLQRLEKHGRANSSELEDTEREFSLQNQRLSSENSRLQSELKRLERELSTLTSLRDAKSQEIDSTIDRLTVELDREKRRTTQLEQRLSDTKATLLDLKAAHERELESLRERLSRTANELVHLEVTNGELREEVDTLESKIAEVERCACERAQTDSKVIAGLTDELNEKDRELVQARKRNLVAECGERLDKAMKGVKDCEVCATTVSPGLMETVEGVRTLCHLMSSPRPPDDTQKTISPYQRTPKYIPDPMKPCLCTESSPKGRDQAVVDTSVGPSTTTSFEKTFPTDDTLMSPTPSEPIDKSEGLDSTADNTIVVEIDIYAEEVSLAPEKEDLTDGNAETTSPVTPADQISPDIQTETTNIKSIPEETFPTEDIPQTADLSEEKAIPETADLSEAVPETANLNEAIPETANLNEAIPETADLSEAIPETADLSEAIPETANLNEAIPETADLSEAIPETADSSLKDFTMGSDISPIEPDYTDRGFPSEVCIGPCFRTCKMKPLTQPIAKVPSVDKTPKPRDISSPGEPNICPGPCSEGDQQVEVPPEKSICSTVCAPKVSDIPYVSSSQVQFDIQEETLRSVPCIECDIGPTGDALKSEFSSMSKLSSVDLESSEAPSARTSQTEMSSEFETETEDMPTDITEEIPEIIGDVPTEDKAASDEQVPMAEDATSPPAEPIASPPAGPDEETASKGAVEEPAEAEETEMKSTAPEEAGDIATVPEEVVSPGTAGSARSAASGEGQKAICPISKKKPIHKCKEKCTRPCNVATSTVEEPIEGEGISSPADDSGIKSPIPEEAGDVATSPEAVVSPGTAGSARSAASGEGQKDICPKGVREKVSAHICKPKCKRPCNVAMGGEEEAVLSDDVSDDAYEDDEIIVMANETDSGNLEITTESPPGLIEHTMTTTSSGNMEITTDFIPRDSKEVEDFHMDGEPEAPDIESKRLSQEEVLASVILEDVTSANASFGKAEGEPGMDSDYMSASIQDEGGVAMAEETMASGGDAFDQTIAEGETMAEETMPSGGDAYDQTIAEGEPTGMTDVDTYDKSEEAFSIEQQSTAPDMAETSSADFVENEALLSGTKASSTGSGESLVKLLQKVSSSTDQMTQDLTMSPIEGISKVSSHYAEESDAGPVGPEAASVRSDEEPTEASTTEASPTSSAWEPSELDTIQEEEEEVTEGEGIIAGGSAAEIELESVAEDYESSAKTEGDEGSIPSVSADETAEESEAILEAEPSATEEAEPSATEEAEPSATEEIEPSAALEAEPSAAPEAKTSELCACDQYRAAVASGLISADTTLEEYQAALAAKEAALSGEKNEEDEEKKTSTNDECICRKPKTPSSDECTSPAPEQPDDDIPTRDTCVCPKPTRDDSPEVCPCATMKTAGDICICCKCHNNRPKSEPICCDKFSVKSTKTSLTRTEDACVCASQSLAMAGGEKPTREMCTSPKSKEGMCYDTGTSPKPFEGTDDKFTECPSCQIKSLYSQPQEQNQNKCTCMMNQQVFLPPPPCCYCCMAIRCMMNNAPNNEPPKNACPIECKPIQVPSNADQENQTCPSIRQLHRSEYFEAESGTHDDTSLCVKISCPRYMRQQSESSKLPSSRTASIACDVACTPKDSPKQSDHSNLCHKLLCPPYMKNITPKDSPKQSDHSNLCHKLLCPPYMKNITPKDSPKQSDHTNLCHKLLCPPYMKNIGRDSARQSGTSTGRTSKQSEPLCVKLSCPSYLKKTPQGSEHKSSSVVSSSVAYKKRSGSQLKSLSCDPICIDTAKSEPETTDTTCDPECDDEQKDSICDPVCDDAQKDSVCDPVCDDAQKDSVCDPLCDGVQKDSICDPACDDAQKDSICDPVCDDVQDSSSAQKETCCDQACIDNAKPGLSCHPICSSAEQIPVESEENNDEENTDELPEEEAVDDEEAPADIPEQDEEPAQEEENEDSEPTQEESDKPEQPDGSCICGKGGSKLTPSPYGPCYSVCPSAGPNKSNVPVKPCIPTCTGPYQTCACALTSAVPDRDLQTSTVSSLCEQVRCENYLQKKDTITPTEVDEPESICEQVRCEKYLQKKDTMTPTEVDEPKSICEQVRCKKYMEKKELLGEMLDVEESIAVSMTVSAEHVSKSSVEESESPSSAEDAQSRSSAGEIQSEPSGAEIQSQHSGAEIQSQHSAEEVRSHISGEESEAASSVCEAESIKPSPSVSVYASGISSVSKIPVAVGGLAIDSGSPVQASEISASMDSKIPVPADEVSKYEDSSMSSKIPVPVDEVSKFEDSSMSSKIPVPVDEVSKYEDSSMSSKIPVPVDQVSKYEDSSMSSKIPVPVDEVSKYEDSSMSSKIPVLVDDRDPAYNVISSVRSSKTGSLVLLPTSTKTSGIISSPGKKSSSFTRKSIDTITKDSAIVTKKSSCDKASKGDSVGRTSAIRISFHAKECSCKECKCYPCKDPNIPPRERPDYNKMFEGCGPKCMCELCRCPNCIEPSNVKPCNCESCDCMPCKDRNIVAKKGTESKAMTPKEGSVYFDANGPEVTVLKNADTGDNCSTVTPSDTYTPTSRRSSSKSVLKSSSRPSRACSVCRCKPCNCKNCKMTTSDFNSKASTPQQRSTAPSTPVSGVTSASDVTDSQSINPSGTVPVGDKGDMSYPVSLTSGHSVDCQCPMCKCAPCDKNMTDSDKPKDCNCESCECVPCRDPKVLARKGKREDCECTNCKCEPCDETFDKSTTQLHSEDCQCTVCKCSPCDKKADTTTHSDKNMSGKPTIAGSNIAKEQREIPIKEVNSKGVTYASATSGSGHSKLINNSNRVRAGSNECTCIHDILQAATNIFGYFTGYRSVPNENNTELREAGTGSGHVQGPCTICSKPPTDSSNVVGMCTTVQCHGRNIAINYPSSLNLSGESVKQVKVSDRVVDINYPPAVYEHQSDHCVKCNCPQCVCNPCKHRKAEAINKAWDEDENYDDPGAFPESVNLNDKIIEIHYPKSSPSIGKPKKEGLGDSQTVSVGGRDIEIKYSKSLSSKKKVGIDESKHPTDCDCPECICNPCEIKTNDTSGGGGGLYAGFKEILNKLCKCNLESPELESKPSSREEELDACSYCLQVNVGGRDIEIKYSRSSPIGHPENCDCPECVCKPCHKTTSGDKTVKTLFTQNEPPSSSKTVNVDPTSNSVIPDTNNTCPFTQTVCVGDRQIEINYSQSSPSTRAVNVYPTSHPVHCSCLECVCEPCSKDISKKPHERVCGPNDPCPGLEAFESEKVKKSDICSDCESDAVAASRFNVEPQNQGDDTCPECEDRNKNDDTSPNKIDDTSPNKIDDTDPFTQTVNVGDRQIEINYSRSSPSTKAVNVISSAHPINCDCPKCACVPCTHDLLQSQEPAPNQVIGSNDLNFSCSQTVNVGDRNIEINYSRSSPNTDDSKPSSGVPKSKATNATSPVCDCGPICAEKPALDIGKLPPSKLGPGMFRPTGDTSQKSAVRSVAVTDTENWRKLDTETLKIKLKELEAEAKERNNEIIQIRNFISGLENQCKCQPKTSSSQQPIIDTIEGLECALNFLQDKCKTKDRMITALGEELRLRADSGIFQKVFNRITADRDPPCPDYSRSRHSSAKLLALPMKMKGSRQVMRTPAEKPACNTCSSSKSETQAYRSVDPSPLAVTEMRRISPDSLLLKWLQPKSTDIRGYEVEVNGQVKSRIHSAARNATVLNGLNMDGTMNLSVIAITQAGERCSPPATAVYQPVNAVNNNNSNNDNSNNNNNKKGLDLLNCPC